jgi:hypothetical protein
LITCECLQSVYLLTYFALFWIISDFLIIIWIFLGQVCRPKRDFLINQMTLRPIREGVYKASSPPDARKYGWKCDGLCVWVRIFDELVSPLRFLVCFVFQAESRLLNKSSETCLILVLFAKHCIIIWWFTLHPSLDWVCFIFQTETRLSNKSRETCLRSLLFAKHCIIIWFISLPPSLDWVCSGLQAKTRLSNQSNDSPPDPRRSVQGFLSARCQGVGLEVWWILSVSENIWWVSLPCLLPIFPPLKVLFLGLVGSVCAQFGFQLLACQHIKASIIVCWNWISFRKGVVLHKMSY